MTALGTTFATWAVAAVLLGVGTAMVYPTLLAAVGALSMQRLGLNVQVYDPMVHYQQVRDAWVGLRNPDRR